jgi:hypothetical protein
MQQNRNSMLTKCEIDMGTAEDVFDCEMNTQSNTIILSKIQTNIHR